MENILVLFVCLASGIILKHRLKIADGAVSFLNGVLIYFFVPVIALYHVPKITFSESLMWLTFTPFIVFGASFLFFRFIAPMAKIDRESKGVLMLTAGIGSTSFVGFPVFELLYGEEGLAYGIILSMGGTILVFNTLGISTLFYFTNEAQGLGKMVKNILLFPPFQAFILAIAFNLLEVTYPPIIDLALAKVAGSFTVIALLIMGLQVDLRLTMGEGKSLALGLLFKLIIAPVLIYVLIWEVLELRDMVGRICILGAAIGSMNTMAVLTAGKGLNPKLAMLMPSIGIPISIPILFIIDYFLNR